MKKIYTRFLIFAMLLMPVATIKAQNSRGVGNSKIKIQKRIALVIGNGNYKHTTKLDNPVNDATDIARTLKELGFEVISGTDQNRAQMQNLIRDFGNRLADTKAVGLFFYAGHGLAANGINYLIPVDADIQGEDEIDDFSVSMGFLLGKMALAKNGFNMVILDACRNNPFARSWRNFRDIGDKGGLARVNAPTGTLIAYATKPGDVASDGDGRNGLYTSALLKQMKVKNVDVTKMLQNVRADVLKQSDNKQVPFDESSLVGDFYFAGKTSDNVNNSGNQTDSPKENDVRARDRGQVEREAWLLIQNSNNAGDFRFFLKEFPNGDYQGKAKIKLEQTIWDAFKNSGDEIKIQEYLNEFPTGANASLARIKLRQLKSTSTRPTNTNNSRPANTENLKAGNVQKDALGISFAYIPPGTFQMGAQNGADDEKPVHEVRISKGYWMGIYEVTQEQWQKVMGNNPSQFKSCGQCPVEKVSWDDAQEFIKKLNSEANDGSTYRLPTEAEWEYAARAGTTGDYAGDLDSMAWYMTNAGKKTNPVGQKTANGWGLYDMHGNVYEWVEDWYGDYPSGSVTDPGGAVPAPDSLRVLRGGSWIFTASDVRSANRYIGAPKMRGNYVGFRLVRTLD
jgi:formylglycine-generating enzyme required for sulfatase activity